MVIRFLLNLLFDHVFSIFVVSNLVIFVWRIIWDTQDLYLIENYYLNSLISILLSFCLMIIIRYKQIKQANLNQLNTPPNKIKKDWKYTFRYKFLIIIFGYASINHWRGVWNITVHMTDNADVGIFIIGIISLLSMNMAGRLCSVLSVPLTLAQDTEESLYQIHPQTIKRHLYLDQNSQVFLNKHF